MEENRDSVTASHLRTAGVGMMSGGAVWIDFKGIGDKKGGNSGKETDGV